MVVDVIVFQGGRGSWEVVGSGDGVERGGRGEGI